MSRRSIPATILGLVISWTVLWVPAVAQSPGLDGPSGPASLPATAAALRMRSVALPTNLPRDPFAAIVAGGPGFIAVGAPQDFDPAFPADSFIVTSSDGLTWTPVDSEELSGVTLEDITAFPGGYVAVGSTNPGDILTDGVALVSADGRTWQRASERGLGRMKLYGVTAWADGVAAVGVAIDRDGVWVRSVVLTSADGIHWTRHRLPRSITDPSAIGAGDGLLAVLDTSEAQGAGDPTSPVVATTSGLETWTRRELGFEGELRDVVVDGDHVIAAGSMFDPRRREHGVLAYSPNAGRRWVRQPLTAPAGSWFTGISLAGPVIAIGGLWDVADQEHAPAAWTSTIGMDWRQIPVAPSDEPAWIEDFAAFPDRPGGVAVGASGEDYDRPAAWVVESD